MSLHRAKKLSFSAAKKKALSMLSRVRNKPIKAISVITLGAGVISGLVFWYKHKH